MKTNKTNQKILVVIVESHQHALEHIHQILRRKKLLQPWAMVHYDAHPDLSCPHHSIPAVACFRPRDTFRPTKSTPRNEPKEARGTGATDRQQTVNNNEQSKDLYEFLDSTNTGIAEWILPLVLAGNLTDVAWIRPPRQAVEQLPAGEHVYHIGAWTGNLDDGDVSSFSDFPEQAIVKVDWCCPYYQDDDSVVPFERLLLPKPLHLSVSDEYRQTTDKPFVLDVCLDYFCCRNPFVVDVCELDQDVAEAFCRVVHQSILYSSNSPRDDSMREIFRQDLLACLSQTSGSGFPEKEVRQHAVERFATRHYHGQKIQLVQDFVECLDRSQADAERLIDLMVEALPHMCMPHEFGDSQQECLFDTFQSGLLGMDESPLLICIARSSVDGFTPPDKVEALQTRVIGLVHDNCCGCNSLPINESDQCRLNVVRDYGPWEGSIL